MVLAWCQAVSWRQLMRLKTAFCLLLRSVPVKWLNRLEIPTRFVPSYCHKIDWLWIACKRHYNCVIHHAFPFNSECTWTLKTPPKFCSIQTDPKFLAVIHLWACLKLVMSVRLQFDSVQQLNVWVLLKIILCFDSSAIWKSTASTNLWAMSTVIHYLWVASRKQESRLKAVKVRVLN